MAQIVSERPADEKSYILDARKNYEDVSYAFTVIASFDIVE